MTNPTETAENVVEQREGLYGHPYDNFNNIAELWSTFLSARNGRPVDIDREDVGYMMILFKVARDINRASADNLVDIHGYGKCIQMIRDKEQEQNDA